MKYISTPIPAELISRPNRFLGVVFLEGVQVQCFIPNPGRMNELMVPGTKVYLFHRKGVNRKTDYDLALVKHNDTLVSIDSRLPNHLLREAIQENRIPEFQGYNIESTEPSLYDSRFDLKLSDGNNQIIIEAKSCTLIESSIALFPDAPTKRGARHMKTLIRALKDGRAAVCFIIQRNDAIEWRPNKLMDPEFTKNLHRAIQCGVEAYAFTCKITLKEAKIMKRIPLNLE